MYIKADGTLGDPAPNYFQSDSDGLKVRIDTRNSRIRERSSTLLQPLTQTREWFKAYVNGVAVPLTVVFGPATLSGTFVSVPNLYLGRREDAGVEGQAGAGYFAGSLDEISLYSAELTQTQIQTIVSAGSSGKCQ